MAMDMMDGARLHASIVAERPEFSIDENAEATLRDENASQDEHVAATLILLHPKAEHPRIAVAA